MGAALAYATTSREFLVAWQDRATTQIHAQRVSGSGSPVGAKITVEVTPYARDPAVGYDPVTDRFLVAYGGCVGNDDCFIHAQRIQAGTGALVGGPITVDGPIKAGYVPELAYDSVAKRFLCVWYRNDGASPGLYGKLIDANGAGALLEIVRKAGSYDANAVAWNPISGTFAVVTHGSTSQDVMIEVSAAGASAWPTVAAFGSTSGSGNFNPRLASAATAAGFLGVTSRAFGDGRGRPGRARGCGIWRRGLSRCGRLRPPRRRSGAQPAADGRLRLRRIGVGSGVRRGADAGLEAPPLACSAACESSRSTDVRRRSTFPTTFRCSG